MSIHRWLNCPKLAASIRSPGDSVLVNAASQAPVPEEGNRKICPVVVLNTFLRSFRTLIESSGNFEERWSSIATSMARCTRSGTLAAAGTNNIVRPGMRRSRRLLLGVPDDHILADGAASAVGNPRMSALSGTRGSHARSGVD